MTKSKFDYAQEKIREALVREYLNRHPGVREQDVVMACKDGELVFMEISAVLADSEMAKQSGQMFLQANLLFSELAIHHDERWKDCIESTKYCVQIVDCLHSLHCTRLSDRERSNLLIFIKDLEESCAKATLHVHDTVKSITELKKKGISLTSIRAKKLVVNYLAQIVEQLKVLLQVYQLEIELGDLFLHQTVKYTKKNLPVNSYKIAAFRIQEIVKVFNMMRENQKISIQDLFQFHENILEETQKTIIQALDDLRAILQERRNRIQEIWNTIATLQDTVMVLDDTQNSDDSSEETPEETVTDISRRMARFLNRFNLMQE